MAWNIKVPPVEVVEASVAAGFSIQLDKGRPGRLTLTYTDEDGLSFGRGRTFDLSVDGLTITDMDRNQQVGWTPPVDSGKKNAAMVEYLTAVVQSLIDQGLATPKR